MKILAMETSGRHSSVAAIEGGRLHAEHYFPAQLSLGVTLPEHITGVLDGESPAEAGIEGIAVASGPGSFTGLRVGIATAKAMAHALSIPAVGIGTHEAIAWPLRFCDCRYICVINRASRDHIHSTVFSIDDSGARIRLMQETDTQALPFEDLIHLLADYADNLLVAGRGVERYGEELVDELGRKARLVEGVLSVPRAGVVGEIAAKRLPDADPEAQFNLQPIYALPSQAERAAGIDLGLDAGAER